MNDKYIKEAIDELVNDKARSKMYEKFNNHGNGFVGNKYFINGKQVDEHWYRTQWRLQWPDVLKSVEDEVVPKVREWFKTHDLDERVDVYDVYSFTLEHRVHSHSSEQECLYGGIIQVVCRDGGSDLESPLEFQFGDWETDDGESYLSWKIDPDTLLSASKLKRTSATVEGDEVIVRFTYEPTKPLKVDISHRYWHPLDEKEDYALLPDLHSDNRVDHIRNRPKADDSFIANAAELDNPLSSVAEAFAKAFAEEDTVCSC